MNGPFSIQRAPRGDSSRLGRRLDFHVAATLLLRGWMLVAGGVTVLGIPFWLTPVEQGYYFTFSSILAIQIFFELGFNTVLVQRTAAEMANLRWHRRNRLTGTSESLGRLGSLVRLSRRAYIAMAGVYFLVASISGIVFFMGAHEQKPDYWLVSWVLMVVFASGNLLLSPRLAIAEGTGRVGEVARLRTYLYVGGYAGAWLAFSCHAGLLAVPIMSGAMFLGSLRWVRKGGRFLMALERKGLRSTNRISWRTEIFPFQWRIALSWISGYLIFQLFNPALFREYGAREAGKVGLLLAVFNALSTLSMSWVNAKSPAIASMLSAGERSAAQKLFVTQFRAATTLLVALSAAAYVVTAFVLPYFPMLRARLPTDAVLLWIILASVSNQLVFSMAVYMRAHGVEPLVFPSIATGLATLAVIFFASRTSIEWTMGSYAVVQVGMCLPWVAVIFFSRFWRRAPIAT